MTQSTILAAATAAGNTSDIVVGATPIQVALFATDGAFTESVQCLVYYKAGSYYYPYTDPATGRQQLVTTKRRTLTFKDPGTYRVSKPVTAEAIGVMQDTTA